VTAILTGRWRLGAFFAAWLLGAAPLGLVLGLSGELGWWETGCVALPLALVYAFLCLGAHYPCRALPLRPAGLARAVATHVATAVASAAVWAVLAWQVGRMLEREAGRPGLGERVADQVGLVFSLGLVLYLLAVAGHYLAAALAASHEAERRALQAELGRREAELAALKARLDPHFLFNALGSIAALAGSDAAQARATCLELAELLRGTLRLGRVRRHPVADELALCRRYLAVEQARFGDRLAVEERVEPECLPVGVPPMLLQPLVENAVKHGVAAVVEGGVVRLGARLDGRRLRLQVENPVDPDAPAPRGAGVGLDLVRRRLRAEYAGAGSLRVETGPGWFRAEVVVPVGGDDG